MTPIPCPLPCRDAASVLQRPACVTNDRGWPQPRAGSTLRILPSLMAAYRKPTSEVYAEMLRTGLNGVAAWWYDHPDVPRDELVELVYGFYWSGLRRSAADAAVDRPPAP